MELKLLPQVIQDIIAASNKPDPDAYVDCFSEDALVLDEGKEWAGKAAIRRWSAEHHFRANIFLEPIQAKQHEAEIVVVFKVDGDFDKTGLPDPLYLNFYFQIRDNKIKRLAIRLSKGPESI
ncbi:nuclear transport factor 2 family protein [Paenibacillus chitinolyticus]|uniref:nuclear transport factor 2 family protein n=1 Tax=Paenibacillus chitinolyticus TaxID=79263 RepID=UPI002DB58D15|nr:nuclear transport factor 2 family protein [Paenibacillus chitinolyticus]MEC0245112.1 nuclear transport factor 2 family protein [Paenibacillus chitinolyticus]